MTTERTSAAGPLRRPAGRAGLGLAGKITLVMGAILVCAAAGTITIVERQTERALRAEFQAKGRAITRSLAAAGQAILESDPIVAELIVYDFRKIPGVAYVVFVDESQTRALVHTFKPAPPPTLLATVKVATPTIETARDLDLPGLGRVLDLTAPLPADRPGLVHVGLAYGPIDAAIRAVVLRSLAALILAAALAMGAAAVLARLLVRPITALVTCADAVGRGDLRVRPAVTTRDELARLAQSVAAMTDQLSAMIGGIAGSAEALGGASSRIETSLTAVVEGSEAQVRLTDQTARAMGDVEGSVRNVKSSVEGLLGSTRTSAAAVGTLSARTEEVSKAAGELLDASRETSESAARIARASAALDDSAGAFEHIVDDTAAAVTAMDQALAEVTDRARETAATAERTVADADAGEAAVGALARHVEESREAGRLAARSMTELQGRMAEVSDVLRLIDEVADQTDLLALNAAIIAAQAGEQGRGFGVVAEEIKALAERTGASVKQIAGVIQTIQENAAATVQAVQASSARMEAGTGAARQAQAALAQIRASSTESGARVRAIVGAAEAHARSRDTLQRAMERLAGVAGEIGAATRDQRSDGARLREVASRLEAIASTVRLATQEQVEQGRQLAAATANVADMVQAISSAARDEERQAQDVLRAVGEISAIARANRTSIGELSAVVASLRERADRLEAEVGRFQRWPSVAPGSIPQAP